MVWPAAWTQHPILPPRRTDPVPTLGNGYRRDLTHAIQRLSVSTIPHFPLRGNSILTGGVVRLAIPKTPFLSFSLWLPRISTDHLGATQPPRTAFAETWCRQAISRSPYKSPMLYALVGGTNSYQNLQATTLPHPPYSVLVGVRCPTRPIALPAILFWT